MVLSRALVGTALGLSLAGCAVQPAPTTALAPLPPTGIQIASLENVLPAQPPVVQKGTVLWRRTAEDQPAPPPAKQTAEIDDKISKLQESLQQMQGKTSQQIAELEQRLKASQEEKERLLRNQTVEAVSSVASLARQSLSSMETVARSNAENWSSATQQMAQLEGRVQNAVTESQQRQTLAEQRLQSTLSTVEQRQANAEQRLQGTLASTEQRLQGTLANVEQRQTLAEARSLSDRELTAAQLAELRKLNTETRQEAGTEIANVSQALRLYADAQFQQAAATTSATVASLAQATNQSVASLRNQTDKRLEVLWHAANQRAEQLAEAKANGVAASLAALQQQTESQRLTPAQIRSIAEQTVAESTPEFRAIALKTMQEGQDYIRTIARSAVQDKDPGMSAALADAARDVITKDDKVVFAIRKAVAEELHGISTDQADTTPSLKLGPDHNQSADAGELDPNRLRIAQLLSPGSNKPAPDAAAMPTTDLASISPASGPVMQGAAQSPTGQKSWAVPGTSLMRARNRADWMDIRQYKVVVHEDDQTLEELLQKVLKHAEPFTGPWQVRWKISEQNRDVLTEKFSLDAETNFEEFVSYLAQYVVNDRGVKLSFSLFDNERIIVIAD